MKRRLTKVAIGGEEFTISNEEAIAILSLVKSLESKASEAAGLPAEVVFKEVVGKRPKGAVYLRGMRTREEMSQKELERKTGISLTNISKYENGSRKITETVAKKFGKVFGVDHRKFLR